MDVAAGDTYEISNSGSVSKAEGDVFLQKMGLIGPGKTPYETVGNEYDRAELFALPHPWFVQLSMPPAPDPTPDPAPDPGSPSEPADVVPASSDIARGKRASASSALTGQRPANAVDGSSATSWSSKPADRQWWRVDLGALTGIGRVSLDWASAYGASVRIETSKDGSSWSTAATLKAGTTGWQTASFASRDARYVRVTGVKGASRTGLSLRDARVGPAERGAAALRVSSADRRVCARRAARVKRSRSRTVRLACMKRAHIRVAARA